MAATTTTTQNIEPFFGSKNKTSSRGQFVGLSSNLPSLPTPIRLEYDIFDYSSAASTYVPEHILQDCATDEGSRWTTCGADQAQFLTLRLRGPLPSTNIQTASTNSFAANMAIITHLAFGKFHKPHVCNLREFRVYVGSSPEPSSMVEVFRGGLENNALRERIALSHATNVTGIIFPSRFVRIVPHASYQKEFPYSIWYLEIHGIIDASIVSAYASQHSKVRLISYSFT
jgi:muskelin